MEIKKRFATRVTETMEEMGLETRVDSAATDRLIRAVANNVRSRAKSVSMEDAIKEVLGKGNWMPFGKNPASHPQVNKKLTRVDPKKSTEALAA